MAALRRASTHVRLLRAAWLALTSVVAIAFLYGAGAMLGDPASPMRRYRGEPEAPQVFVRGTLQREEGSSLPALCSVVEEKRASYGKSARWREVSSATRSHATLKVEWSSSPIAPEVSLSSLFEFDPRPPGYATVDEARLEAWTTSTNVRFSPYVHERARSRRVRDACLDSGDSVFVHGCVSASNRLGPCPGELHYTVVPGGRQTAIDAAADAIALRVAAALLAILAGVFPFAHRTSRIAKGLEDRAEPRARRLPPRWLLLLLVPPVALLSALVLHEWWPLQARVGFALGVSVLALWQLFALGRWRHSRRSLLALGPVLDTPRTRLADATGTVELAVRAQKRGSGTRALIGDDVVAYSEVRITTQGGPRTTVVHRSTDELDIADKSGGGILKLGDNAILDVEVRRLKLKILPPRYAERGISLAPNRKHRRYIVEERVIRDGARLYVYGDVQRGDVGPNQSAYRSVTGATTLGGTGIAPVLVYSGSERGLVAALFQQARRAKSLSIAAACATTGLALVLAYLALL